MTATNEEGVRLEIVWRSAKWQEYNRGYGLGPSYSDHDARGSLDSSVEPGRRVNGAYEFDGRPPFRYNSAKARCSDGTPRWEE